ncbi:MAG: fumarylacetoacetate hydrolase family protein [Gammaproteobacteria bacterium]
MKLLTIDCREIGGRPGGVLPNGDIVDLTAAPSTMGQASWIPHSVVSVLAAGQDGIGKTAALLEAVAASSPTRYEELRRAGVVLPFDGTVLLPPVRRPGLVLVTEEDGRNFIKSPNTAVGSGAAVDVPWQDDSPFECSGMLAAVIGRPLYRADSGAAAKAIAGYTLLLDLSAARTDDWRRYIESKQFPGACPMGPAIVTGEEFGDPSERTMRLALNGVEVAAALTYAGAERMQERLADLSQRYSLRPGDLVGFGSPTGDSRRNCRLHRGDALALSIDDVMTLEISIA